MTRKRRPLAALALIAIVALITACGSTTPSVAARGSSSGGNTVASSHVMAVEVAAHSSLPTRRTPMGSMSANAPAHSLPGRTVGAPRAAYGSALAPSQTGTLPSTALSPVRSTPGTLAGSTSADAPARWLPGQ